MDRDRKNLIYYQDLLSVSYPEILPLIVYNYYKSGQTFPSDKHPVVFTVV